MIINNQNLTTNKSPFCNAFTFAFGFNWRANCNVLERAMLHFSNHRKETVRLDDIPLFESSQLFLNDNYVTVCYVHVTLTQGTLNQNVKTAIM